MIKSLISNYISKYVTNISPANISYSIFSRTLDLYNVSINPDFIPNIKSNITHLKYTFSLSRETIIINELYLQINQVPSFNENDSANQDIQIFKATVEYGDFEIRILEVIDNIIRGVEVFYKKTRVGLATKLLRTMRGIYINKACVDLEKIQTIFTKDNCGDTSLLDSYEKCFKIFIEKANVSSQHACLKDISISESKLFSCDIRKTKFLGMKFRDTSINIHDKIIVSNEDLIIEFSDSHLKAIIYKNIFQNPEHNNTEIFKISSLSVALQHIKRIHVSIIYLENKVSFELCKDVHFFNFNDFIYIEKVMFYDEIIIQNMNVKESLTNTSITQSNIGMIRDLIPLITKYIDCNIIINNFTFDGLFINRLVYKVKNLFNPIDISKGLHKNLIDIIEIEYTHDIFMIKIENPTITDPMALFKYFQKESSLFRFDIQISNMRIIHNELELVCKTFGYDEAKITCNFDIIASNNYFIDNCLFSYNENNVVLDKLFVNASDNIFHSIRDSGLFNLYNDLCGKLTNLDKEVITYQVDTFFLNVYDTANKEIFVVILNELVLSYSTNVLSLNIKKGQIDNQEYLTKYPVIFKSLSNNFLTLYIANGDVYLDLGKFKVFYDELMNKIYLLEKYCKSSTNELSNLNLNSLIINDVECTVFYKFFIDIKLDSLELKSFSGSLSLLKDRIYRYYRNTIPKKILGLLIKNIKNNIYQKSVHLGYKNDINLPVPWYTGRYIDYRIKYPMPMRLLLDRYDIGLCIAYYIFNKMDDKYKDEAFKDGSYANIMYKNISQDSFLGDNCLILSNKRLLLSSKISIKEVCIEDIAIREINNYFMIGNIKIEVERKTFISSLYEYLM